MEDREKYILLHTYQKMKRSLDETPFSCLVCSGPLAIFDRMHGPVLWCPMDDTEQPVTDALLEAIKEEMDGVQLHS